MKKYYQPKGGKKGRFALRENTYRRIWYLIADYPYYKAVQRGWTDAAIFSKHNQVLEDAMAFEGEINAEELPGNGQAYVKAKYVNCTNIAEPIFEYDVEKNLCERYIWAIEDAMEKVPPLYVKYILSHIINRRQYKEMEGSNEKTLKMWVQRFIWHVAHNLGDA